jgi:GntR family transcriptional regulator
MFVLPGAADKLRVAERDYFVNNTWPRVAEHINLLGLNAADLLERDLA